MEPSPYSPKVQCSEGIPTMKTFSPKPRFGVADSRRVESEALCGGFKEIFCLDLGVSWDLLVGYCMLRRLYEVLNTIR